MAKVLAVVTSTHSLPGGGATGFWLEELSTPYFRFVDAGHEVAIASPAGGPVTPDAASLADPFITDTGHRLLEDPVAQAKLASTIATSSVSAQDYDAIYLVGGVGAAFDFDGNAALDSLVAEMAGANRIVSGVCHGVIGLTTARGADGAVLARGQRMTGFSRDEEIALGLLEIVPVVPEQRIGDVGAHYTKGENPFDENVAEGPLFVTGQNPASAGGVADVVLARLGQG